MTSKHSASNVASWLLHGAKDLVWQADPAPAKATAPVPRGMPTSPLATHPVDDAAPNPTVPVVATVANVPASNALSAELLAMVMRRPTAYSALADAIAALGDIALDDTTRTRAAFAVLKKTQQRSVEQIVQAVDIHLGLLDAERTRFASQSREAEDAGITAKAQQAERLQQSVQSIGERMTRLRADTDAQLVKLQQQQTDAAAQADAVTREVVTEKARIARTKQDFEAAATSVEQWLHAERSALRQRLANQS